jgi:alkanesulfonate monooxygenase SsuD/methylene tetrahydromethanopterin reductase-like flavin-dependent oxidoreductase (luciferase family)
VCADEVAVSLAIDIGVGLPVAAVAERPEVLLDWAARVDAGPFSCLAVPDRVVYDAYEPLVVLAAAAGVTRRVRLLTSILLGPTRETTLLARQAASVDGLSGGRLVLGLGIGVRTDDYAATGTSFATRGRRLDEQLAMLRRIWAGEPVAGDGRIGPPARRPTGPEVLVGGYVDAVARRVATWGDGYMAPGGGEPARVVELWGRIREAWTTAGRAGEPRFVGGSYYALGRGAEAAARAHIDRWYGFDPALAERRLRGIPTTADDVEAVIARHVEMGCGELVLRSCGADLEGLEALAELVGRLRTGRADSPAAVGPGS